MDDKKITTAQNKPPVNKHPADDYAVLSGKLFTNQIIIVNIFPLNLIADNETIYTFNCIKESRRQLGIVLGFFFIEVIKHITLLHCECPLTY